jgi:hypothetical protein
VFGLRPLKDTTETTDARAGNSPQWAHRIFDRFIGRFTRASRSDDAGARCPDSDPRMITTRYNGRDAAFRSIPVLALLSFAPRFRSRALIIGSCGGGNCRRLGGPGSTYSKTTVPVTFKPFLF